MSLVFPYEKRNNKNDTSGENYKNFYYLNYFENKTSKEGFYNDRK